MIDIINKETGATLEAVRDGSNMRLVITGNAQDVKHALTLLFNYGAVATWPEAYSDGMTGIHVGTTRKCFMRGLFALFVSRLPLFTYYKVKTRIARCSHRMQAAFQTAHYIKAITIKPVDPQREALDEESDTDESLATA